MQRKIASFKHILFPDTGCESCILLLFLPTNYRLLNYVKKKILRLTAVRILCKRKVELLHHVSFNTQ